MTLFYYISKGPQCCTIVLVFVKTICSSQGQLCINTNSIVYKGDHQSSFLFSQEKHTDVFNSLKLETICKSIIIPWLELLDVIVQCLEQCYSLKGNIKFKCKHAHQKYEIKGTCKLFFPHFVLRVSWKY